MCLSYPLKIEGVFQYASDHRETLDIISSDSAGPNTASLKEYLLFRSDWIEVLKVGRSPFWKFRKV